MPQKSKAADRTAAPKAAMPVALGRLGDRHILVLTDSGAITVMVKRSLVKDKELTGEASFVKLADSTIRHLPEARIRLSTPNYSRQLHSLCLDLPL